jgi:3-dehydroquinate synthase
MIGTITQPAMVWSDLSTLNSLPKREILCGLGEIIKYGIIKDADLFELVERNLEQILSLEQEILQHVVSRCSQIKADIVAQDEKESGLRMLLNLGHTIGHALEAGLGYGRISHGEGVLLGMCAEGYIAEKMGFLAKPDFDRITGLINRLELSKKRPHIKSDELIQYMRGDKKAATGRIKFVLPAGIGSTVINDSVEDSLIRDSLDYLLN